MNLLVLGGVGAGVVLEKGDDGRCAPVHILGGPEAARRWTESHYERVDWESPHRASALVGLLSCPGRPGVTSSASTTVPRLPLTYETAELRAYLPELVAGRNGPVILQRCEEYLPESERWEPFVCVLWESGT